MDYYLPLLAGKRVGMVCNQTARVGDRHLVDTLLARGVDIVRIFAPEHGFRGEAGAGEAVDSYRDKATGVEVASIYGATKKPAPAMMKGIDLMLFDIQDVGVRFYTFLSSMHYVMESCAENGVPLIVLDRPNPNGMYVDGPILDMKYRSFVGMEPVPVVHGMTLGELARMINGQGWLAGGEKCKLTVVPCLGYTHRDRWELPVAPSPNLPNMRAVYLYPSLCLFEGTPVSVGRGTAFPFQIFGHPAMKGRYGFTFTPRSLPGAADPPLKGQFCYGMDLRSTPSDEEVIARGFDVQYIIDAYNALGMGPKFFTPYFEKLIGVDWVRGMIVTGKPATEIRARWQADVERFKQERKPYLLYDE